MQFLIISSSLLFLFECSCWVVLDFPQVKELYTTERSKHRGPDPFFRKGPRELKRYCDELRKSGIYGMWGSSEPQPPMIIAPHIPAPNKQSYELIYKYQKVVDVRHPVPMFPCLTHANDGYWHLSYGFNDDYLFIFSNADEKGRGPIFEVKGLLERSPRLDKNLQRTNVLEMVFWNVISTNKAPLPDLRGKSMQHFRLCSLVLDTIRNTYSPQKVYTLNFGLEYGNGQQPLVRPIMFQFLKRKALYAGAIPCAMNRSFKRPSFFVVPDPSEPQSVFVLMENEDLMDSKTKFIIKYYVRDVSVLKNWSRL